MPRRTKEDALATREALLDAAERVFQRKGVSATSLADIASDAGATRGAIYWHFKDKADLFNAMMDRVLLPLEHPLQDAAGGAGDPLPALRRALLHVLHRTANDPRTRRVFEVATHKVEYVGGLGSVRERHLAARQVCLADLKRVLRSATRARGVSLPIPLEAGARGLHALVDGLIQNWMLDTDGFDLERCGRQAIDAYLAGIGLAAATDAVPAKATAAAAV